MQVRYSGATTSLHRRVPRPQLTWHSDPASLARERWFEPETVLRDHLDPGGASASAVTPSPSRRSPLVRAVVDLPAPARRGPGLQDRPAGSGGAGPGRPRGPRPARRARSRPRPSACGPGRRGRARPRPGVGQPAGHLGAHRDEPGRAAERHHARVGLLRPGGCRPRRAGRPTPGRPGQAQGRLRRRHRHYRPTRPGRLPAVAGGSGRRRPDAPVASTAGDAATPSAGCPRGGFLGGRPRRASGPAPCR